MTDLTTTTTTSAATINGTTLLQSILGDELDVLDPEEFDIPSVSDVPSLDEILKEEDNGGFLLTPDELDEFGLPRNGEETEDESSERGAGGIYNEELSDVTSIPSTTNSKLSAIRNTDWKKPKRSHKKSDISRFTKLRGISSQIESASQRVSAGSPTALATTQGDKNQMLTAVGTTQGMVLVFESTSQVLKYCIGAGTSKSRAPNAGLGHVSAVSFNCNGSKLLIAFSKGHLHFCDTSSAGRVLLELKPEDCHQIGQSITQLHFTEGPNIAVCVDSGGSVFELRFTSGLMGFSCKFRCLFSGAKGEVSPVLMVDLRSLDDHHQQRLDKVCAVSPLTIPPKLRPSSKHYSEPLLLAMASLTKIMVVSLRPKVEVKFALPFTGPPNMPPLLAWQWIPIQISKEVKIVDPVIAFCRAGQLSFYQIHTSDGLQFRSFFLKKVQLTFEPITMDWLNNRCLALMDVRERLHLYEASSNSGDDLEVIDATHVQLLYSSADYKGLATGGNVSKALEYMSDHCCYQSVRSDSFGSVLVLGLNGLYAVSLRTWLDRVDQLVQQADYPSAIQLALDFYTGTQRLGVGGQGGGGEGPLGGGKGSSKWKSIIADKTVSLLLDFVEVAMTKDCPNGGRIELLQEHYKNVVPVIIESCTKLQRWELLYNDIYERFEADMVAKGFFLECLEEYLLDGKLPDVPPALVQDYLNYLEQEGMLAAIEASIIRLPITTLDLHQVMVMCRTHGLYDGIIYVHNQALSDYLSPLQQMIADLRTEMDRNELLSDQHIQLGNKILLYISCCLEGRSYAGQILERPRKVSNEIYQYLISSEATVSFPNLRTLLLFDTREFLNVLSMSFQCEHFSGEEGVRKCQRLIDHLLEIVVKKEAGTPMSGDSRAENSDSRAGGENVKLSSLQMGAFLTFIARLAADKQHQLHVSTNDLQRLLKHVLCNKEEARETSSFEEREQSVLNLLNSESASNLNLRQVLEWAETGKYLQVCEFLYLKERKFDRVMDCYLESSFKERFVFQFIQECLTGGNVNWQLLASEKLAIRRKIVSIFTVGHFLECYSQNLCKVDMESLARIVCDYMESNVQTIFDTSLKADPQTAHQFLTKIIQYRQSQGQNQLCEEDPETDHFLCLHYIRLTAVDVFNGSDPERDELIVHFVRQWCLRSPEDLATSSSATKQKEAWNKRINEYLKVLRQHNVLSGILILLEDRGDVHEAAKVVQQSITEACEASEVGGKHLVNQHSNDVGGVVTSSSLAFCRRCESNITMSKEERQELWFQILDSILSIPSQAVEHVSDLKELLRKVMDAMISYVKPSDVLERLFDHPAFRGGVYSEYSDMIETILKSYDYEEVLRSQVVRICQNDSFTLLNAARQKLRQASRGYLSSKLCYICSKSLEVKGINVLLNCGHMFHKDCLFKMKLVKEGVGQRETGDYQAGADEGGGPFVQWFCPFCTKIGQKNIAAFASKIELPDFEGDNPFGAAKDTESSRGEHDENNLFSNLNLTLSTSAHIPKYYSRTTSTRNNPQQNRHRMADPDLNNPFL